MKCPNLTSWLKNLDLFGPNQGRVNFDLEVTLEHLRHLLPNQGPLKDFIAHNTLHGFQSLPFHEGIQLAGSLFGAKSYLEGSVYEDLFRKGKISDSHLEFVKSSFAKEESLIENRQGDLSAESKQKNLRPPDVSDWGLRKYWIDQFQLDLFAFSSPIVCKWIGSYLDQGIAFWPMPARKDSLWLAMRELSHHASLPLLPFQNQALKSRVR